MKKAVTIFLLAFVALASAGCDIMDALKLTLPQKFAISVFFYNYRTNLIERRRSAAARGERDTEAETVLDAFEMLREQQEADRLLMTGWARSNTSMMDEAIRRRPEDWTYRSSRAALALQLNDMTGYEEQLRSAEQLAEEFRIEPAWYARQLATDLETAESRLRATDWHSGEQCQALYAGLAAQYTELLKLTGEDRYMLRLDWAKERLRACPEN